MSDTYQTITCPVCKGKGRKFDITNVGNASGTVDPSGLTTCYRCHGDGSTSVLMSSIAIRTQRCTLPEATSAVPDWMLGE